MTLVYFATNARHCLLAPDDNVARRALEQRGHVVRPLVWSTCSPRDIPNGSTIVMRSIWDYHLRQSEFQEWLIQLAERDVAIYNPPSLLQWNVNKRYLDDLAAAGIDAIPTAWAGSASTATLAELMHTAGWDRVVVKPTVSASAYMTTLVSSLSEARAMETSFCALRSRGEMMVQPYLEEVATQGEWSMVFLGGNFSHAVLKTPAGGDFRVQVDFGGSIVPATPPDHALRSAIHVLAALPCVPLYARIDGVVVSGRLLLMEAECIDPVLYFSFDAYAADKFADSLEQLLKKGERHHASKA